MSNKEFIKNLEHSDSFCTPDQHIRLLTALEHRNFEKFEEILKTGLSTDSIDVNHWYDDPHYSTLLDICCKSCGNSQFVKLLLRYGANPNLINKTRKKGPIHFATEYSDFETVKYLIQNSQTDVNLSDNTGSSALHIAAKTNKIENLKILLQHPKININSINKKGQTPLHIAANQTNKEVVCILLNHPEIDLDGIKMYSDETCRDVIKEKLPELVPQLLSESERSITKITDTNTKMFSYLYRRDCENFIKNLKTCENIDDHDGGHTYLQYACDFGLTDVVKCLLDSGVNPNKCCPTNNATPLMIAAKRGYVNIIKLLTQQSSVSYKPINEESVLHSLIYGISLTENNDSVTTGEERNIYKCLEYILEAVSADKLDINRGDLKGNTALHYAGKLGEKKIILMLLKHGAYIGKKNIFGEPAVANIPRKVLEEYLDECIDTNEKLPREDNYEVIFNYNFLVPPKQFTTVSSLSENAKTSQVAIEMDEDVQVPQIEVPHTHCETAPLLYMSKYPELRPLLKHPVFTSFINLKWYSIRKYFYINLIFYLTFWFLLTYYILTIYGTMTNSQPGNTMISNTTAATTNNTTSKFDFALWIVMLILCLILTIRELFQFTVSPLVYLATVENWLEIGLIITTCIILLCAQSCHDIRNQVSAVAILLSWTELVLLIGRHPLLSTNIEMFKTVTYNFLKFLAWYSIFILAFALSFYMLFKDDVFENNEQNFFQDPAKSLFKSVVMLTGEFDASSIPFQAHPGISHILFVLFVFLIAIVLFNLLNGLAVSDTQAIKADAELVSYVSRIKLIAYFESMIAKERLPKTDKIRSTLKCCCITPAVRRRTRTHGAFRIRKSTKNSFYKEINLFPNLLPDNLIRVLPNQECRVVLPNCNQNNNNKTRNSDNSCMENCQAWYIDPPIIKCAKTIVVRRTEMVEDDNTNIRLSLNKYQDQLTEYKQKLENVQKDSEKTKEMLQEILALLHRTTCDSKL